MGSSPKRRRIEAPVEDSNLPNQAGQPSTGASQQTVLALASHATPSVKDVPASMTSVEASSSQQHKLQDSWYGTWPRKSSASTQVARETIMARKSSNTPSSESLKRVQGKRLPATSVSRPPSMYLGKAKETCNITMGGFMEDGVVEGGDQLPPQSKIDDPREESRSTTTLDDGEASAIENAQREANIDPGSLRPATSSGWLGGWFGKSDIQAASDEQPVPSASAPDDSITQQPDVTLLQAPESVKAKDDTATSTTDQGVAPRSWFGIWATTPSPKPSELIKDESPVIVDNSAQPPAEESSSSAKLPDTSAPAAGSSWAFWSASSNQKQKANVTEELGELAVAGDPSQDHPKQAKASTAQDKDISEPVKGQGSESSRLTSESNLPDTLAPSIVPQAVPIIKAAPPNLLLPSVTSTYKLLESPSFFQQISRLLLNDKRQPTAHVLLTQNPPQIKSALAIGIHGLFPATLIRTVIGQPTGTSVRFANHAATAIKNWADKNGSENCEIQVCCLEGEGKIAERVDNLWKLLLNWVDQVKNADFILIACHSQGVPVALMLIAKLIEFGVVSTNRIGVCAMAGVSLGPFSDYKSRLFSGSAAELFDFADPQSIVSKRYEDSLRVALKYGVRITYCGSIDDQLVSMESSTYSIASHPYIYRAVFVDGRLHAPDFLTHLVGLALKLRNLGVPDHGLIRELSASLAGSLYTGEGHSRLYDDSNVYRLAVEFALQTTSVDDTPLQLQKYEIPNNANPYVLPWIMRGLLEEEFVKKELSHETTELLKQFDGWKPSTKVLKDVKYRLEAVRSKL